MNRNLFPSIAASFAGGMIGGAIAALIIARPAPRRLDWTPLRPLVHAFASADECVHLRKLASGQPFPFVRDETTGFFEAELRRLRKLGLIDHAPGKSVDTLLADGGDARDHLLITPMGREYLALRDLVSYA
jgi:hypothetical protein